MSSRFWTKVKGLLGLGAVGAGIGAVFGTAWFTISGLLAGTVVLKAVANAAIVYGSYGFFTASGLGLFLASARSKDSLEDVSVTWAGLVGAVGGAVFPVIFNVLMMQSLLPLRMIPDLSPIVLSLGFFGGVMTGGMVAAAKQEHRKEVGAVPEPRSIEGESGAAL